MTDFAFHQPGIVGTGRVAQALAVAFAAHATSPPLVWGRNLDSARSAAKRVGGTAVPTIDRLTAECDIIAIAVADDALEAVAADMAPLCVPRRAPFIFHVSGRSDAAVLEPLRRAGARTAAIHPAMTFTGNPEIEARRMATARFAVTGSTAEAAGLAKNLVALLGGVAVEIAADRRTLYHAALCHASNHLVTLIAGASHALEDAGVDDPGALLAPLVRAALENSLAQGLAGLSGPLLRGDRRTIADHLETIAAHSPDLLPAYRAMARATLDALENDGRPVDAELDRLLSAPRT